MLFSFEYILTATGCGIANKQKRIVGGQETEVNMYPWMALLTYSNRFYCGASLINDRYVMTAAHCVSGFNKDRIGVTLLEHDRSTPTETELIKRRVRSITQKKTNKHKTQFVFFFSIIFIYIMNRL